jgi:hypothetical protein
LGIGESLCLGTLSGMYACVPRKAVLLCLHAFLEKEPLDVSMYQT